MKRIFFLGLLFLPLLLFAQKPGWQWGAIANNDDMAFGQSVQIDPTGNVYALGTFLNTLTIDTFSFPSAGKHDIILMKYNTEGQLRWAKNMGGSDEDGYEGGVGSIAIDLENNIYLACLFSDTMTVDSHVFISNGGKDIALMKIDSNGNLIWGKSYGSIYDELVRKVTIGNNNLYLCGLFSDAGAATIQFGSFNLLSNGASDIFLLKADTSGNIIWARNEGNSLGESCGGITVDSHENVYITGSTGGNIKFEHDTLWDVAADILLFVVKYDSTGNELWAKTAYSHGVYYTTDIDVDTNGYIYTIGFTTDDNNINFGSMTLVNQYFNKAYLAKYNPNGQLVFAKNISSYTFYDEFYNIKITPLDNYIYLCGKYNYLATFGSDTLHSYGHDDILVLKLDENGNVLWATHAGGNSWDGAYAMAVAANGDIAITGYTASQPCKFGNNQVSASDARDIFVAKLSTTTGVHDITQSSNLVQLYPNPAHETITIKSKENMEGITVYDITGRVVAQQMMRVVPMQETSLDTHELVNGLYFLMVNNTYGETVTQKLMIQH